MDRMDEAQERVDDMGEDGILHLNAMGLARLPPLPADVKKLYCYDNWLRTLPPLPNGLKLLYCNGNKLTTLPNLPETLEVLNCTSNELTTLPPLPGGLKQLYCHMNLLTQLPTLPDTLELLICSENELTRLPKLPETLLRLDCDQNQLRTLPILPESLTDMNLGGSTNRFDPGLQHILKQYDAEKIAAQGDMPSHVLHSIRKFKNPARAAARATAVAEVVAATTAVVKKFVRIINTYLKQQEHLKENIVAARFDPRKIQRNMNRNRLDPDAPLSEENWEKYYTRRGEVWTEGVGTRIGGKTKKRKSSKRKTRKV